MDENMEMTAAEEITEEAAAEASVDEVTETVAEETSAETKDEDKKKKAVSDGGLLTVDTDRVTFISGSFEFDD